MAESMQHSFTVAEEKALFAELRKYKCVDAERDLYWMMLARYTARRVETLHLMDVDDACYALDTGYLDIASEKQKGGKAGSARGLDKSQSIYLVDKARTALLGLLKVRKQMIKRSKFDDFDEKALILSKKRSRMSIRMMQERMKMWCKRAGVPAGTPHWWRHTWAVRRLQNAAGSNDKALREIQDVLGHKFITTTQIYTKPNRDDLRTSMMEAAI